MMFNKNVIDILHYQYKPMPDRLTDRQTFISVK